MLGDAAYTQFPGVDPIVIVPTPRRSRALIQVFSLILLAGASGASAAPEVWISEFLAVNEASAPDQDGEYTDWIELYNRGPGAADLTGWYLTDDSEDLQKWAFPAVSMPQGGYLLVRASGKDRADPGSELHTNFKVGGDGEFLALVESDGTTVAFAYAPEFPRQRRGISYGVEGVTDPNNRVFFTAPTPEVPNGAGIAGFVADTTFSVDRGYFTNAFSLVISSATPGATIRYTTDGTTPSASHGSAYLDPIPITGSTVVRAVAVKTGLLPSDVDTQSYLFLDDVVTQPNLPSGWPAVWNGGYRDYQMDPEITQDPAYADEMVGALTSLPVISVVTDPENLFGSTGIYDNPQSEGVAWERPCSVEIFYPDGSRGDYQNNCGLRIQGGASRLPSKSPKHSFRLLFKDLYGPTKLRHDLFGGDAVDEIDTVVLRAGFNQSWIHHNNFNGDNRGRAQYLRDQWAKDTQLAMGQVAPHNNDAHLFVNGLYWGLYNPSERPAAGFAAAYHGGEKEEYDALNSGAVVDGNSTAWNELFTRADRNLADTANYQAVLDMLDVDAFIDYMILNHYAGNQDWDSHNWYAYRRRAEGASWYFSMWDSEFVFIEADIGHNLGDLNGDNHNHDHCPIELLNQLDNNPEFRVRFGDRVQRHLFLDGVLTTQSVTNRWEQRAAGIFPALVAESARWGDFRRDVLSSGSFYLSDGLYDRDDEWAREHQRLRDQYFPYRRAEVIEAWRSRSPALFPRVKAPEFGQHGGTVPYLFQVTLSHGNRSGALYVTTDGSDPRDSGGAVGGGAVVYDVPITVTESLRVKARVLDGGAWSPLAEAVFHLPEPPPLRVTEIMYNPAPPSAAEQAAGFADNDEFEYIELMNVGSEVLDLSSFRVTDGVGWTGADSGDLRWLASGARAVVVRFPDAFLARYGAGIPVAGTYTNSLRNSGEDLRLETDLGQAVLDFDFNDGWFPTTDGEGAALEIIDPLGPRADWGKKPSWRATWSMLGTPGAGDPDAVNPGTVVISEALTHTDASPVGDWIELRNTTDLPVSIGGWYLSDDASEPAKYRFAAGTVLDPQGFSVFSQTGHFGVDSGDPGALIPFGLSELGETVVLSAGEGGEIRGYRETEPFGAAAPEVPFARHVKSTGKTDFPAVSSGTLGKPNTPPLVGPVVISEIMYHPVDGGVEYIECVNISGAPVTWYDPAFPSNRWQFTSGVAFTFPQAGLPVDGVILVVPEDPAIFRTRYDLPPEVQVVGPYIGALDNAGEDLILSRPGTPEPDGTVPAIQVDRVNYKDGNLWPATADGLGASLARRETAHYGNDVANWMGDISGGSPGNQAPWVDAGVDQTLILDSGSLILALEGSFADDGRPADPGVVTGQWTVVEAPTGVSIVAPDQAQTSVEVSLAGVYRFRLRANDGLHAAWDDVTFTVIPPPPKDVLLTETDSGTVAQESGGGDTVHLVLTSPPDPATTVTVGLTPIDGLLALDPMEVVFTVSTWQEPQAIQVTAVEDDIDRGFIYPAEVSFAVTSGDPGYEGAVVSNLVVSVLDDDDAGTFQFVSGTLEVDEGGGSVSAAVSRVGGTTGSVTLDVVTADGTATGGVHYQVVSNTLSWAAGDATDRSVPMSILPNDIRTGHLTFELQLADPSAGQAGSPRTATVTILDDERLSEGWPYRMVVQTSGYDRPGALEGFPLLVNLSESIPGFSYDQFSDPQGGDLRFTDGSESEELPYEIETWDPAGTSSVWVRVPRLEGPGTRVIAYWGGAGLTRPDYTSDGSTWVGGFAGIWHLHGNELDATGYAHHGTPYNLAVGAGVVGQGRLFNGSSSYFEAHAVGAVMTGDDFSYSTWFRTTYASKQMTATVNQASGANVWRMAIGQVDPGEPVVGDGNAYECDSNVRVDNGLWHHLAYRREGGTGTLYVDGLERASHDAGFSLSAGALWAFGQEYDGGPSPSDFFHGELDEIRMAGVPRSADWFWAEWNNVNANQAFLSYGAVEAVLPELTLEVLVAPAREEGLTEATVVIRADAAPGQDLPLSLRVDGTAEPGTDYAPIDLQPVLSAGEDRIPIALRPLADDLAETNETIRVILEAGSGYRLGSPEEVEVTLEPHPMDTWRIAYFPDPDAPAALPGADWDLDRLRNRMEFLLGRDPTQPETRPVFERLGTGDGRLRAVFTRRSSLPVGALVVEFSPDLKEGDWVFGTDYVQEQVISSNTETQTVEVLVIDPVTAGAVRLRGTNP